MSTPKRLDRYPAEFFQLFESAARDSVITLPLGSGEEGRRASHFLQQRLHAFRRLLEAENHPHARLARNIVVSRAQFPDGSYGLNIMRYDATDHVRLMREALSKIGHVPEELPSLPAREPASARSPAEPFSGGEVDPVETALRKLGFFTKESK